MSVQEEIVYSVHNLTETVVINNRSIRQINISSHYTKHHKEGVSEKDIINLVNLLNQQYFPFDGQQGNDKNYFRTYLIIDEKKYKIVWW